MCNLSEGIAKAAYERGYQMGCTLTLYSCVQDGYITLERASELSGMSDEEFLQKAEEYKDEA